MSKAAVVEVVVVVTMKATTQKMSDAVATGGYLEVKGRVKTYLETKS